MSYFIARACGTQIEWSDFFESMNYSQQMCALAIIQKAQERAFQVLP